MGAADGSVRLRPAASWVCVPVREEAIGHADGRVPAQRRMRAYLVGEVDPRADDPLGVQPVAELMQVHRLVLQQPPQLRSSSGCGGQAQPGSSPADRGIRSNISAPWLVLETVIHMRRWSRCDELKSSLGQLGYRLSNRSRRIGLRGAPIAPAAVPDGRP